jgi:putative RecB family exonuclease
MNRLYSEGRIMISASRLNSWISCPLRWHEVYVRGAPFRPSPAMIFGSATHIALERLHRDLWLERDISVDELVELFWSELRARAEEIDLSPSEIEKLGVQGKPLLELYISQYEQEKPVAVELDLTVPVVTEDGEDLGADLHGFIDLLTADGRIVDLKTSARSAGVFQQVIQTKLQLDAYRYLLHQAEPGLSISGLEVRRLIRTKVPKIEVHQIPISPFGGFLDTVRRYVSAVQQMDVYPRPGFFCNGDCPAAEACRQHHAMEVPA